MKLKEGETGATAIVDTPEVVSDEASQTKKRRGTKRKRSSVDAMIELEDDEPRPKRRRTRELARELIEATDSTVTVNALLSLLKHPNADVLVKDVLNKYADEELSDSNNGDGFLPSSPVNDHDSVMLDLVALELKEMEMMRQEEERIKEEEERRLKEEEERWLKEEIDQKAVLNRRRSGRNSLENSSNGLSNNNNSNNTNNSTNNNTITAVNSHTAQNSAAHVISLASSTDAAAVLEQGFRSNEVKDEAMDGSQTESTPFEDEGKRTRRGRKTSLPAKYADSVSLDTSVKLPQAPLLTDDSEDEPGREAEKLDKKSSAEKEKEKEKEKDKEADKPKEKTKEKVTPSERRVSGRRKKSDVAAELEKQKKLEHEEEMKKLRAIFRHIDHMFTESDFDDVVFIKMTGYPQWPAAVIKVAAETRLPPKILRHKTPKRADELRCVVFLCDPKAPFTWQPASAFIPFDEVSMQDSTRALRLKLGVRLGESLEDTARLRNFLFPDKPDLLPYVHEFRKQHDPHYNPTAAPRPKTEAAPENNTNVTANGTDAESAPQEHDEDKEDKPQEPVKESERATRAKKRRSSTEETIQVPANTNTPRTVPTLQQQAQATVMRQIEAEEKKEKELEAKEKAKKEAEQAAANASTLVPITDTTTPGAGGRGGRRKKSQPEPVTVEKELPKTEPKVEPASNTNALADFKPSTSSIESTEAQQTSSAESTTIDLTRATVLKERDNTLELLNALMELACDKPKG